MHYAVRVFYNGSKYFGYQRQPKVSTVEGEIISALIKTKHISSIKTSNFKSASRTDRYVNAIGNVFSFKSLKTINLNQINAELQKSGTIICWAYACVDERFSPRYATYKRYWYVLPLDYVKMHELSLQQIKQLSKKFEGTHDFHLFCKRDHRDTIRKINKIAVYIQDNNLIFEFMAQSFLWQQIRRIVSYIINYPFLPHELKNIEALLSSESMINHLSIQPADPKQLILVELYYPQLKWVENIKAKKRLLELLEKDIITNKMELSVADTLFSYFSALSI